MDKNSLFMVLTSPEENKKQELTLLNNIAHIPNVRMILRKPDWEEGRVEEYISELPEDLLGKVIIYREWKLMRRFFCFGVHFPSNLMEEANKLKEEFPDTWGSTSVHTLDEVNRANDLPLSAVLASPVFHPCSKTSSRHLLGLEGLRRIIDHSSHPCIALGGITEDNYRQCLDYQAAGIASIGSVWKTSNPAQLFIGESS